MWRRWCASAARSGGGGSGEPKGTGAATPPASCCSHLVQKRRASKRLLAATSSLGGSKGRPAGTARAASREPEIAKQVHEERSSLLSKPQTGSSASCSCRCHCRHSLNTVFHCALMATARMQTYDVSGSLAGEQKQQQPQAAASLQGVQEASAAAAAVWRGRWRSCDARFVLLPCQPCYTAPG